MIFFLVANFVDLMIEFFSKSITLTDPSHVPITIQNL